MSEDTLVEQLAKMSTLEEVYDIAKDCVRCPLSQSRTRVVFGEGDSHTKLMFVGEAPENGRPSGSPLCGKSWEVSRPITKISGSRKIQGLHIKHR